MSFEKEEKLRKALEQLGRVHDCVEAGCHLNPDGLKIPEESKPKRRRIPTWIKEIWKELKGHEWPAS